MVLYSRIPKPDFTHRAPRRSADLEAGKISYTSRIRDGEFDVS